MEITLRKQHMKAVVTTKGGELIYLEDEQGRNYIWNGDPAYWFGRNPLLFPIVGNLKDGKILMDGHEYHMNRHGFARDQEFTVIQQGEDFVIMELVSNDETLHRYPRCFSLQVKHELHHDGFTTSFKVTNKDHKSMPFCIGAHTAFHCPINEGESFEDYQIVFDQEETAYPIRLNDEGLVQGPSSHLMLDHERIMTLDYDVFAKVDTVIFRNLKSTGVGLYHKENGQGVHMSFEGFPMMAFWTKGKEKAPFICIEPWHGCAALEDETGLFEDKEACLILESGKSKELRYKVSIVL